jgi:hypothetical protein
MQFLAFNAFCKFEIGDKVQDAAGNIMTITDIASISYVRGRKVEFRYEFDNNKKYVLIEEK